MNVVFGALLLAVASCTEDVRANVQGRWVAEQTPAIALYFYADGTASLSGAGLLNLEWKAIDDRSIRIDALDRKVIFHFKMNKDKAGAFGILELAGYDTMIFRKR